MRDADPQTDPTPVHPTMSIFRAADAKGLMESGCMTLAPYAPGQGEGMRSLVAAGLLDGDEVKVLCDLPGFSLTRAWLKAGYPLPLHSHDGDCLYHIVAGALRLGTEDLGSGDSFFVPAGCPYNYKPGPEGVEVLEFRHQGQFNFLNLAKGAGFYEKAAATITANREEWRTATPPSAR
ncbi:cupin domain-containing protein [uncultured Sphingomonas sp.]|uniref:cupin domain-containing protein n=1 Tax=uncultured Sphingomonas sp. TaxID=158754 RepID=UPI0026200EE7|nr:cupin domain-containing protein [uncultured Sphingomonas sp.]